MITSINSAAFSHCGSPMLDLHKPQSPKPFYIYDHLIALSACLTGKYTEVDMQALLMQYSDFLILFFYIFNTTFIIKGPIQRKISLQFSVVKPELRLLLSITRKI